MHYWRHDPADWPRILDAVASLGYRVVDTYVPWSVHEREDGTFDFSAERDVEAFLALAAERSLRATIRPGPACGAELPDHGYPWRVLRRSDCQARRPGGAPYILPTATHHIPVPSYGAPAFIAEVERWYAAVGERLAKLQWPLGPIVACQVDNEMGYFFQPHPYALDYHPDVVARFSTLYDAEPPRDGRDEPESRRLNWMRFREEELRSALATLAGLLRGAGFDRVPLFHNDYARTETPLDLGALERSGAVDVAGLDAYSGRAGSAWLADTLRHLAGSSRLPWMPELGAGWLALPWLMPAEITAEDQETAVLTATAVGVRAYSVYMLVDRDRWYGAPISARGELRPGADLHRQLNEFFARARLEELEREVQVLLVDNRLESRRLAARATLGDLVPAFAGVIPFDFSVTDLPDARREERARWAGGLREAIRAAGCDYNRAASSALPPHLDRYPVIAVTVLEKLDDEARERLSHCSATVACGPALPAPGPPRWRLLRSPSDLSALLPEPAFRASVPGVEVTRWLGGGREVIAVMHHQDGARPVELRFQGRVRLEPLWPAGAAPVEGSERTTLTLPPWSVAFFAVRR